METKAECSQVRLCCTALKLCHINLPRSSVSEQCHQDIQIQHFHLPASQPLRAVSEARQCLLPLPHDPTGRQRSLFTSSGAVATVNMD